MAKPRIADNLSSYVGVLSSRTVPRRAALVHPSTATTFGCRTVLCAWLCRRSG